MTNQAVTYQIVASGAREYALKNKETGQFDHEGFISPAAAKRTFDLHFAWRPGYRLERAA